MQESSDDIFKEISKLHFIQRAGNMRKQWISLLNVCLAHLSMQEGVSICVMRVKWRKANGILQELNAVPLNCWSAPFLRTGESRFLLVLLLISLNLWMFGFRYFLRISLFNFEVFMHVYSEKKCNFQCTPTRTNSTILSQHNPPNFTPFKNNPLSTMLSICMWVWPSHRNMETLRMVIPLVKIDTFSLRFIHYKYFLYGIRPGERSPHHCWICR